MPRSLEFTALAGENGCLIKDSGLGSCFRIIRGAEGFHGDYAKQGYRCHLYLGRGILGSLSTPSTETLVLRPAVVGSLNKAAWGLGILDMLPGTHVTKRRGCLWPKFQRAYGLK